MNRLYYLWINVAFAILIVAWLIASLVLANFQPDFNWYSTVDVLSICIIIPACAILFFVTFRVFKKFLENNKDSALLLATFNLALSGSITLELLQYFYVSHSTIGGFFHDMVYVLVAWGFVFFLLFLQEIFTGSFKFKDHIGVDVIFLCLIGFGITGLVIDSLGGVAQIYVIPSFASLGIAILLLSFWELIGASRLTRKTMEDKNARIGLSMIALSGLVFILLVLAMLVGNFVYLSISNEVIMFSASLLLYLGYIFPSRKKSTV